jgi:hypothetical protein
MGWEYLEMGHLRSGKFGALHPGKTSNQRGHLNIQ